MSAINEQSSTGNGGSPFGIGNIRLFLAFRVLFNARFYYPVFTVLFLDYGLTIEQFAMLNAVWAITIVCAEIPSGAMADLLGRKRLLVITSLIMVCEMSLLAFVPLASVSLVFWAFLVNRMLSGLAEAMASGADEAIAYDSLIERDAADQWPLVLSRLMRLQALAGVIAMTIGALVYDPVLINELLAWCGIRLAVTQQITMRFPVYLTLVLAILATLVTSRLTEKQTTERVSLASVKKAFFLTVQTGWWIIHTPFALAVMLCSMLYDHLLRLIITLASQYFRLIHLPEASFGIIMASLSLIGLVIAKPAQWLVQRFSPRTNYTLLALLAVATLWGLSGFHPYIGILPMAGVMVGLLLTSFFTSHYLNLVTPSAQRATTLSFKGMLFNLSYGMIGMLFALLINQLRAGLASERPPFATDVLDNEAFRSSFLWFPWYGMIMTLIIAAFFFRHLQQRNASSDT